MKERGITLVVLVITMVIMLTIVGVVVTNISTEGLIDKTRTGAILMQKQREEEEIVTIIWAARAHAIQNAGMDEMKSIFDKMASDDKVKISAIKRIGENQEYYAYMDDSTNVEGYLVNLRDTKGYIFALDADFNIISVNGIAMSEWNNNSQTVHVHTLVMEDVDKRFECDPDKQMYKCTRCDYEMVEIIDEGTGHVFGETENIKETSCTENGINRKMCSICGIISDEVIDALGHKEAGQYSYSSEGHYHCCERCGLSTSETEGHEGNPCRICGYTGKYTVTYELSKMTSNNNALEVLDGTQYTTIITPENTLAYQRPESVSIMMGGKILGNDGYTYNNIDGKIVVKKVTGNIVISASATRYYGENTSFTNSTEVTIKDNNLVANIDQSYRIRVFKFVPTETANYRFYSQDPNASSNASDPYVYIFDDSVDEDVLDNKALRYSQTGDTSAISSGCLAYNDDGGTGYNFSVTCRCTAGKTYYMVIRTYTPSKQQRFINIYIRKN